MKYLLILLLLLSGCCELCKLAEEIRQGTEANGMFLVYEHQASEVMRREND